MTMALDRYTLVEEWTEDQLSGLPDNETDYYEFKSSQISPERLKKEITVAASAFWNSGGGIFIAGLDDHGQMDGGLLADIGKQKIRDWADQVLSHVEPIGPYAIATIEGNSPDSKIKSGHVVLVIGFGESPNAPHMAPDYRYYIRAGTHSLPAGHFIVEAIRAKRGLSRPLLRGLLQLNASKTNIVQLVVLGTNDATALDVHLTFDPMPRSFHKAQDIFPLKIPVIDRNNPFSMDLLKSFEIRRTFGEQPIYLELFYHDIAGEVYRERQLLDPSRNLSPVQIGSEDVDIIKKSLRELVKQMKRLNKTLEDHSNGH
jgi:Putative DNA-binding domain